MCSIAAGMATLAFNRFFGTNYREWREANLPDSVGGADTKSDEAVMNLEKAYSRALEMGAVFDARVFNIPKEEVANCIFWRQLDASRNSIQMVGQTYFRQKELQNKSCTAIQDMLMTQKGINWNDFPAHLKRGSCCIKEEYSTEKETGHSSNTDADSTVRTRWRIDREIPIFKGEDRQYIERLIEVGD